MPQIQYAPEQHPTLSNSIGQGLGQGLSQAVQNRINKENMYEENNLKRGNLAYQQQLQEQGLQKQQMMQQQQQQQEASALQQALQQSGNNPQALFQSILTNPGISDSTKKTALDFVLNQQKQQQKQALLSEIFPGLTSENGQAPGLNQQASASKAFDPANIDDSKIAALATIDPNLARTIQSQKEAKIKNELSQKKFEASEKKATPEFRREEAINSAQAKTDIEYNKKLQEYEKNIKEKQSTLDRLEQLNQKGVTGKPYEKALEKFGLVALTSDGRREFSADIKNLITDIRSILGSQFTGFEFQTILNAYPSPDFSKGANASIIKNIKEFNSIKQKEFDFARDLKKENKGKIPEDFQSQVNERLNQYTQSRLPEIKKNIQQVLKDQYSIPDGSVLMIAPDGQPLSVREDEIDKYLQLEATLP